MELTAVLTAQGTVTGATLVAAPQAGWAIVVDSVQISVGAAATQVTLGFGATNEMVFQMAINSNIPPGICRWVGTPATALTLTTSAGGPTSVTVQYHLEQSPPA